MVGDLAIYGAGGLGRELALLVHQLNVIKTQWNLIGFFDDYRMDTEIDSLPRLGGLQELNKYPSSLSIIIAIADPDVRQQIYNSISNEQIGFPMIAHPVSQYGSITNRFGRGTILTSGCTLTTGIELGDFVIINLLSTIGHDARIGNYCSIMPSVNISGNVILGEGVLVGSGATILQGLTIGDHAIIGAGAVVTRSVPARTTVVGIPAKKIKR